MVNSEIRNQTRIYRFPIFCPHGESGYVLVQSPKEPRSCDTPPLRIAFQEDSTQGVTGKTAGLAGYPHATQTQENRNVILWHQEMAAEA